MSSKSFFNDHDDLRSEHSFLSPSKHSWINYTEEKLEESFSKYQAAQRGTDLHNLACECIRLGVRLPKSKKALNAYVNDAIGFRMTPEQVLFYSYNCFGTADAICFRDNILRIHDLKTGSSVVYISQLEIYTSLFCLEYDFSPENINIELRIYQGENILVHNPDPKNIKEIMGKIILFDKKIEKIKELTK